MLANYQVVVTSLVTGRIVAVYDSASFYSLKYQRRVNDIGIFVIVFPFAVDYYAAFDWDNYVEIYRTDPNGTGLILEETYLVRAKQRFEEDNQEKLVVGGVSLTHLLARRIIDPDDDPTATDGYSKKSGSADTVMRGYAREQAGDLASAGRAFPSFTVESVTGSVATLDKSFRYDNLFTAFQEMANGSGIDFYLTRTGYNFVSLWIAPIGNDYTVTTNTPLGQPFVVLSPTRGNLQEPAINIDRTEEKNFVYCLGQGQGEERLVVKQAGFDVNLTAYNRIEFVKDARNIDKANGQGLIDAATATLNDKKALHEFSFKPTGYDAGSIYRRNWDVADFVTVKWGSEQLDLRIKGVDIEIDESGEKLDVIVKQITVS